MLKFTPILAIVVTLIGGLKTATSVKEVINGLDVLIDAAIAYLATLGKHGDRSSWCKGRRFLGIGCARHRRRNRIGGSNS